jgi:hypothetical protein
LVVVRSVWLEQAESTMIALPASRAAVRVDFFI